MSRSIPLGLLAASFVFGACSPKLTPVDPPVEVDPGSLERPVAELFERLVAAAREQPDDGARRGELAMAYDANGLPEPALRSYAQARVLDPQDPRWPYHAAVLEAEHGDPAAAVALFETTIALDPRYVPAHWRLGALHYAQGSFAAAESAYARAAELRPQHPAGTLGLARIRLQTGRPEEAVALLEAALDDEPRLQFVPYLHYLLGSAYRQLGRLDDARLALAKGRSGRPLWKDNWRRDVEAYRASLRAQLDETNFLLETDRAAEAIPVLEALRGDHPEEVGLLDQLSRAYFAAGRAREAKEALRAALEREPDHPDLLRNLGTIHRELGEWADALATAERLVEVHSNRAASHRQLASVLEGIGRREEALSAYRESLRLDPADVLAWCSVAGLAADLGRIDEAKGAFARAERLRPGAPELAPLRERLSVRAGSQD